MSEFIELIYSARRPNQSTPQGIFHQGLARRSSTDGRIRRSKQERSESQSVTQERQARRSATSTVKRKTICRNCGQPYVKHQAFMENCPINVEKRIFETDKFWQPERGERPAPNKEKSNGKA